MTWSKTLFYLTLSFSFLFIHLGTFCGRYLPASVDILHISSILGLYSVKLHYVKTLKRSWCVSFITVRLDTLVSEKKSIETLFFSFFLKKKGRKGEKKEKKLSDQKKTKEKKKGTVRVQILSAGRQNNIGKVKLDLEFMTG